METTIKRGSQQPSNAGRTRSHHKNREKRLTRASNHLTPVSDRKAHFQRVQRKRKPKTKNCLDYDMFFRLGKKNRVFAFHDDEEHLLEKARVADAFSLLQKCEGMTDEEKNEIRVILAQYNTILERHFDVLHKSEEYEKEQEN